MNDLKPKSTRKEPKTYINQNPLESLGDIGRGVRDSFLEEVVKKSSVVAKDQVLHAGEIHAPKGGELQAGEEIDFTHDVVEPTTQVTEIGHEFVSEIVRAGAKTNRETSHELQVRYNEVLLELKALGKSSKELKTEVETITIEQPTENIGVYQVSFVEGLLLKLRELRESVDDGLAWFKALRVKKASRQYGVMAKRAGTSFTLNNERSVATQTG